MSNRMIGALALTIALCLAASAASAQRTRTYCISVKTWTEYGAGTDNHIDMTMYGAGGGSEKVRLKGSHESDDLDEFDHDMTDIGIISKITIDVDGTLADNWSANYVRIYRNTTCTRKNDADGWTEFSIKESPGYDPKDYVATFTERPKITVSPSGQAVLNRERITIVNFANVSGSVDQEVMQFKESWSRVDEVGVSRETVDTVGAGITVGYESPQTVAGTFSAEASASWQRAIANARSESRQMMSASEYSWNFVAPARTFVMRRVTFEIPYADQLYKSSTGESRAIRKVGAQIRPVGGAGEFLEIPQRLEDGSIRQVGLETLEKEWFAYIDPTEVADIRRRYLNDWLQKGYVVRGTGGGVAAAGGAAPAAPQPAAPAAPRQPAAPPPSQPATPPVAVAPPPPAAPPATVDLSRYTTAGVNGRNLKAVRFGNGAKFVQTAPNVWTEYNDAGKATFRFQETGRDDWSVYVNDPGRNVQLQFDVHRKMILLGTGGPLEDQWPIVEALTPASGRAAGGGFTTDGVNGRNVVLAAFAQGRFQQTAPGRWQEFDAQGAAAFSFRETGRDDWSVYLNDPSRNVQIQIDIHRKMVSYGQNGGPKSDLYPITSSSRPQ